MFSFELDWHTWANHVVWNLTLRKWHSKYLAVNLSHMVINLKLTFLLSSFWRHCQGSWWLLRFVWAFKAKPLKNKKIKKKRERKSKWLFSIYLNLILNIFGNTSLNWIIMTLHVWISCMKNGKYTMLCSKG